MRRETDFEALVERASRKVTPVPAEVVEYLATIFGPARQALLAEEHDKTLAPSNVEAA